MTRLGEGRLGAPVGGEPVGPIWRGFFWAAALFGFAIGALAMFSPAATADARVTGLLWFCFGLVFMLVAREPLRFVSVLWPGLIAKAGMIFLLAPSAVDASGDPLIVAILAVEGLFALGFLGFLMSRRNVDAIE